ncbi:MAG: hypothetical protein DHS20C10_03590 [marine bacterium B5-7]|nr:MAG: hypothetical protein DHS20C10_03590 [marine bacterium B5-7]
MKTFLFASVLIAGVTVSIFDAGISSRVHAQAKSTYQFALDVLKHTGRKLQTAQTLSSEEQDTMVFSESPHMAAGALDLTDPREKGARRYYLRSGNSPEELPVGRTVQRIQQ